MFDIGFWELSVIGVIGLLVLGPERLPKVARVVGGYLRKARSTWANVRAEISAELNAEEFKEAMKQPAEELKSAMAEPMKDLESLKKSAGETMSFDQPESSEANQTDAASDESDAAKMAEGASDVTAEADEQAGASDSVPDKTA
ncbi:MAG: Sec-independent protein translocase protein TatB [Pseudomonadota bacterium]